jgi:hypothetical protein
MWNYLYCYLSGQHDFGVRCEPGSIHLRCIHCGKRSAGWALSGKEQPASPVPSASASHRLQASNRARPATTAVASV